MGQTELEAADGFVYMVSMAYFFYFYSFLGWIFESSYVSVKQRRLVNRGFLRIPLLPLYGSGALMMLIVSRPFQDSLLLTWLSGFTGATVLEYGAGWAMEQLFKVRYWDYSSQRFNFHGYICLSSSVAWGFLDNFFMTDLIHRPIEKLVCGIPVILDLLLILPVTAVFLQDAFASIREALDFGHSLERANQIRQELDGLRVQTALLKSGCRGQNRRETRGAGELAEGEGRGSFGNQGQEKTVSAVCPAR